MSAQSYTSQTRVADSVDLGLRYTNNWRASARRHRVCTPAKENAVPPVEKKTRGPKALDQEVALERVRASIKKLPVKRTPLDTLIALQESNLNAINAHANAENERATGELLLKQKQHLLEEFREGVWTVEEYCKKVRKLEKGRQAPRLPPRQPSPDWDEELPSSDPPAPSSP
ncbi:hypothetical protein B0H11DRAFT_1913024 [Mycena galericulata]|nr:hypothetical protein B0H11DRAFT_1913024 [Mycena galericulata]